MAQTITVLNITDISSLAKKELSKFHFFKFHFFGGILLLSFIPSQKYQVNFAKLLIGVLPPK